MKGQIFDYILEYSERDTVRAHMPGHKGKGPLGIEAFDITEVDGADSLYEAKGIIAESERAASRIFGADSYYSTEGSSLSIKAMLYLAVLDAKERGVRPVVAAGRNAHKSFINAAALLGFEIIWLSCKGSYLSYIPEEDELSQLFFGENAPSAVYITSPDYLGNIADVSSLAKICHENGALLLVDNAHGAYLKFLDKSLHPIDLGADMCCDSAHKTLPSLTGAGYLHISKKSSPVLSKMAKYALSIFGSTSPSYLIMASLDSLNPYLDGEFSMDLSLFCKKLDVCKQKLTNYGYCLIGNEPLKICISSKPFGYRADELADIIRKSGIEPEFADPDYLVLMLSPSNSESDIEKICSVLMSVEKQKAIIDMPPEPFVAQKVFSPREAFILPSEEIPVSLANGRILASASLSCPPAVPILVMGELIDERAIEMFKYYGIEYIRVLKV